MPWLNDLVSELEAASLGVGNTSIFISLQASIPVLASGEPTIHLVDTGGTSPDNTQNSTIRPAYVQPSAQVTVRAGTYEQAYARAEAARNTLYAIRNKFINSGWYLWVKPTTDLIEMPIDDRKQSRIAFNVIAKKRP